MANYQLHWSDLDGRKLPDGDRITSSIGSPAYSDDDPRRLSVVVRLELGPGITWYKSVELADYDGNEKASCGVHDAERSAECTAQIWPPSNGARRMILWKAKFLGIHTALYEITDLQSLKGKTLTLQWLED